MNDKAIFSIENLRGTIIEEKIYDIQHVSQVFFEDTKYSTTTSRHVDTNNEVLSLTKRTSLTPPRIEGDNKDFAIDEEEEGNLNELYVDQKNFNEEDFVGFNVLEEGLSDCHSICFFTPIKEEHDKTAVSSSFKLNDYQVK